MQGCALTDHYMLFYHHLTRVSAAPWVSSNTRSCTFSPASSF